MTDATELDIDAIRSRVDAATEGPWERSRVFWKVRSARGLPDEWWVTVEANGSIIAMMPEEAAESEPNAEFIAHAHADLPAALDEVTRLRAALDEARAEVAKRRGDHDFGSFMSQAEWDDWSNSLARLVPEEYEDDIAQEAIIERALADLVRRAEAAEDALAAVRALADLPYGSERWGLLHDGSRYVAVADLLAALATPTTTERGE